MKRRLEAQAIEALRDTLRQISVIKVKDLTHQRACGRGERMILGHIEISGHAHLLACKLTASCQIARLRQTIEDLREVEKQRGVVITPILIAPSMSEEAQNLCREKGIGFLDLEGNARLYLDEVFIVKRSLQRKTLPPPAETLPTSETAHFAQVA